MPQAIFLVFTTEKGYNRRRNDKLLTSMAVAF